MKSKKNISLKRLSVQITGTYR